MKKRIPTPKLLKNVIILAVQSPQDHYRTRQFLIRTKNSITAINPGSFKRWCKEVSVNYVSAMSARSKNPNREIPLYTYCNCHGKHKATKYTLLPKNTSAV